MRDFKNEKEVEEYRASSGKQIIIFEGTVYDVSGYISHHPGGADLVEDFLGKSIDEAFKEHGHSNQARLVFRDLEKVGFIVGSEKPTDDGQTNIKGMDGYQLQSKI